MNDINQIINEKRESNRAKRDAQSDQFYSDLKSLLNRYANDEIALSAKVAVRVWKWFADAELHYTNASSANAWVWDAVALDAWSSYMSEPR